mmetsp:Transcript_64809/g.120594  ORF Transcript_64809/g.120594 Transcript_64809/m.120594 type:complete len:217 (+) Transcript_64809:702-1352(+)
MHPRESGVCKFRVVSQLLALQHPIKLLQVASSDGQALKYVQLGRTCDLARRKYGQCEHLQQVALYHISDLAQSINERAPAPKASLLILRHHYFGNVCGKVDAQSWLQYPSEGRQVFVHEEGQPMVCEVEVLLFQACIDDIGVQVLGCLERVSAPTEWLFERKVELISAAPVLNHGFYPIRIGGRWETHVCDDDVVLGQVRHVGSLPRRIVPALACP